MTTLVARPVAHTPMPALVALVAVAIIGLVGGLVVGYAAAPRAVANTPASAQVAADNALVDRWIQMMDTGTREQFDAMVNPHVRFSSAFDYTAADPGQLWWMIDHARTVDKHVHTRTGDVTRIRDNVLVWTGTWHPAASPSDAVRFAQMVRLDVQGRFLAILETGY